MAVSITNLISSFNDTAGTSFTTSSISPSANKLQVLSIDVRNGVSTNPVTPTVTGCNLTWEQINSTVFDNSGTSRRTLFLFRALGPSTSSGALTIDFGAVTHTNIVYSVDEFTGMDTSGTNGSGAIVQSAVNQDTSGAVATITATLAAFATLSTKTVQASSREQFNLG